MDTFRASEATFGSEVGPELLLLEGLSDGQDVESVPESGPEPDSSGPEKVPSRAGLWCKLVSVRIQIVLLGIGYMWTGCFFAFLGDVPRAFGWQEAGDFAISWAGNFTISFVAFFALLFTALSVIPPIPHLPCIMQPHGDFLCMTGECIVTLLMYVTAFIVIVFLVVILIEENSFVVCRLLGILVAANQLCFLKFFDRTQRNFHAPYTGGFLEAMKGFGYCLGLIQVRPTNAFDVSTLWAVGAIAVWGTVEVVVALYDQQEYSFFVQTGPPQGMRNKPSIPVADAYWYAILTRVIKNRSFWSLTCYCLFCSGPFLSLSYWWCSAYLMDIYGLDDSSNNETVAFLWLGVIVGSIVFPLLFFAIQPTKWIPFSMSVVAFIVILCISIIPCWRMRREYFVICLVLLGMTAGSCKSVVYPLYLYRFGSVPDTFFAMSLTTYLTVLSGFVYHLISSWLLSLYVSKAKSSSRVERLNVYQLSVWLLCAICFGLASFAILWATEPASKCQKAVEAASASMETVDDSSGPMETANEPSSSM